MATTTPNRAAAGVAPQFMLAGSFLQSLAGQDFVRLGGALATGARLRALLPSGLREWTGAEAVAGVFAYWFGDTEDFELVEAAVSEVGGRLHLRWRLRLRAQRPGTRIRAMATSGWSPNSWAIRAAQPRTPNWRMARLTASAAAAPVGTSDRCSPDANSAAYRASFTFSLGTVSSRVLCQYVNGRSDSRVIRRGVGGKLWGIAFRFQGHGCPDSDGAFAPS